MIYRECPLCEGNKKRRVLQVDGIGQEVDCSLCQAKGLVGIPEFNHKQLYILLSLYDKRKHSEIEMKQDYSTTEKDILALRNRGLVYKNSDFDVRASSWAQITDKGKAVIKKLVQTNINI